MYQGHSFYITKLQFKTAWWNMERKYGVWLNQFFFSMKFYSSDFSIVVSSLQSLPIVWNWSCVCCPCRLVTLFTNSTVTVIIRSCLTYKKHIWNIDQITSNVYTTHYAACLFASWRRKMKRLCWMFIFSNILLLIHLICVSSNNLWIKIYNKLLISRSPLLICPISHLP